MINCNSANIRDDHDGDSCVSRLGGQRDGEGPFSRVRVHAARNHVGKRVFDGVGIVEASMARLGLEASVRKGSRNDGDVFQRKFDVADLRVELDQRSDVGVFGDQPFLLENVGETVVLVAACEFGETHFVVEAHSSACNHFAQDARVVFELSIRSKAVVNACNTHQVAGVNQRVVGNFLVEHGHVVVHFARGFRADGKVFLANRVLGDEEAGHGRYCLQSHWILHASEVDSLP